MTKDPRAQLFSSISNLRQVLRFAHERRHLPDQQQVIAQKVEQALSMAIRILQDPIFADISGLKPAPKDSVRRKTLQVAKPPQPEPSTKEVRRAQVARNLPRKVVFPTAKAT